MSVGTARMVRSAAMFFFILIPLCPLCPLWWRVWLLRFEPDPRRKRLLDDQLPIDDGQWQLRERTRRRPVLHTAAILRIELRVVTRTRQRVLVGEPVGHVASVVRAN